MIDNRCIQTFDEVTTKDYGTRYKNDFNYQLDIKLNEALPEIFQFDKEQEMIVVLKSLKERLTEEVINLYLWKRENRVSNTFLGIEKAIEIYKNPR